MERFRIRDAGYVKDRETASEVLVLAEHVRGERGRRLEIQRRLSYDEQDRRLGQDTYCLVMETGATVYGGVTDWRIEDRTLRMTLTSEAARVLGVDSGYELALDPATVDVEAVSAALNTIVGAHLPDKQSR